MKLGIVFISSEHFISFAANIVNYNIMVSFCPIYRSDDVANPFHHGNIITR
ncbi:hypothetical protein [Mycoplasma amphoriforme]|uniref:hypothetical protein n=1 Tax=Mycoplasma amphoriforme TaxID=273136 RepID=UPI0031BB273B